MFRTTVVACSLLLLCSCANQSASSRNGKATVVRVVDGDTIVVRIGGHDENVRLLGIDTSKP
jgi:endonuclease YncB( thermonuclease family)